MRHGKDRNYAVLDREWKMENVQILESIRETTFGYTYYIFIAYNEKLFTFYFVVKVYEY